MSDPTPRRIRRYGERGLLIELRADEAPHAVAAAIRALHLPGIDDVVPAACTVLVTAVRPLGLDALAAAMTSVVPATTCTAIVPVVELPTVYDGPDLDAVAAAVGLEVDEVVERHRSATYTVAFVGFAPGFAYLTGGDPRLRVARHAAPRPEVPSGSVGIADRYTGVYPRASPGGWQLIGRTDARLFDPACDPPSPLAPGTTVRFVPAARS